MDEDDVKESELVADTPEGINYSYSKLRNQGECSARIYFAQLAKEGKIETDPALPLLYGSAAHKGIEVGCSEGADRVIPAALEYIEQNLTSVFPANKLDQEKMAERHALMIKCLENFIQYQYPEIIKHQPQLEVKLQAPFRKGTMRGVIDVLRPDIGWWKDWKTGMKIPSDRVLLYDPQAIIYYWLGEQNGMVPPKRFDYVYLAGKNMNMVQKTYGPDAQKAGQTYMSADKKNPKWKFTYPVLQDADKVKRIWNDWVVPLAIQYENKSYVKRVSDMNCAGCMYRTACPSTPLPEVIE